MNHDRLADVNSRFPRDPAIATAASLPKTWIATMIIASDWVGLTFRA